MKLRGWRQALLAGALWLVAVAGLAAPENAGTPLLIGFEEDPTRFGTRWGLLVYTEAFRRLDLAWQPRFLPLARRTAMLKEGSLAGENGRTQAYGEAHPDLLRVDEAVMEIGFGLYSANPNLQLGTPQALAEGGRRVDYRRGIVLCERRLKALVPIARLAEVRTEEQGLRKLLAGRSDVYCELDHVVLQALAQQRLEGGERVRKVAELTRAPLYPYLHGKHTELAPRLAASLRQMRAEGLIERYRRQAEKEAGWVLP